MPVVDYLLPSGMAVSIGEPFTVGEVNYPANWIEHASPSDLHDVGILRRELPDPTPPPFVPTANDVNAERDSRLRFVKFSEKIFDFMDGKGSPENISGGSILALSAMLNGKLPGDLRWADPDKDFMWIAADNTLVTMDAQTMFAFGQAAAAWKSDHIHAARVIKNIDPIPDNYRDHSRWPY